MQILCQFFFLLKEIWLDFLLFSLFLLDKGGMQVEKININIFSFWETKIYERLAIRTTMNWKFQLSAHSIEISFTMRQIYLFIKYNILWWISSTHVAVADDVRSVFVFTDPKSLSNQRTNSADFHSYYFIFHRKCLINCWITLFHFCILEIDKSLQFIVVPLKLLRTPNYINKDDDDEIETPKKKKCENLVCVCHVFPSIILHKSQKHLLNCQSTCREQKEKTQQRQQKKIWLIL